MLARAASAAAAAMATTATSDLAASKRSLRRAVDAVLKARAPADVAADSARICAQVATAVWFQRAGAVAAFLSMPHEVQTGDAVAAAITGGKQAFVPRVTGPRSGDMEFLHLATPAEVAALPLDRWGIPTPGDAYAVGEHAGRPRARYAGDLLFDLVLVPGVAFDRAGGRLGHGKGYYDAFLSGLEAACAQRGRPRPVYVVRASWGRRGGGGRGGWAGAESSQGARCWHAQGSFRNPLLLLMWWHGWGARGTSLTLPRFRQPLPPPHTPSRRACVLMRSWWRRGPFRWRPTTCAWMCWSRRADSWSAAVTASRGPDAPRDPRRRMFELRPAPRAALCAAARH